MSETNQNSFLKKNAGESLITYVDTKSPWNSMGLGSDGQLMGKGEAITIPFDAVLLTLCNDRRGGRPWNLLGTGVLPCKCDIKSEELAWCSMDSLAAVHMKLSLSTSSSYAILVRGN